MSWTQVTYRYDGSYAGFLTCIYEAYVNRESPIDFRPDACPLCSLYPERTGAYSWWSYRFHARENNAGWRIDYFIVSRRLMPRVKSADIWPEVTGSDHCPVVLELAE